MQDRLVILIIARRRVLISMNCYQNIRIVLFGALFPPKLRVRKDVDVKTARLQLKSSHVQFRISVTMMT